MFGLDKTAARIVAILAAVTLLALIFGLWSCQRTVESRDTTKALQRNDEAKDKASIERTNDTAEITNAQQERNDVIKTAPAGQTGPATFSLNCQRWLREHGGKAHPACSGLNR